MVGLEATVRNLIRRSTERLRTTGHLHRGFTAPAAQAGDAEAQYYLSAALAYRDETFASSSSGNDKVLTVDEAIAERNRTNDWAHAGHLCLLKVAVMK